MIAKIKTVEIGAEYQDTIYDYWIDAILTSGEVIKIFDFKPFDLRNKIEQTIDLLISVELMEGVEINPLSPEDYNIIGEFVDLVSIPSKSWEETAYDDKEQIVKVMIKTRDGMLYLNKDEFESKVNVSLGKVDQGTIIGIKGPRFRLLAVNY